MVVQVPNPPEPSSEVRPLNHDEFFVGTFQRKRLAQAFLRIMLPAELLGRLDLDGLTAEPRHITDELFKTLIADVVYRVPIKGTDSHINFFIILEHKSYNDFWTIFQLWGYVSHVIRQEFKTADDAKRVSAEYRLPPVVSGDPASRRVTVYGKHRVIGLVSATAWYRKIPAEVTGNPR